MSPSRPIRFCMLTTFYPPWNFGGDGIHVRAARPRARGPRSRGDGRAARRRRTGCCPGTARRPQQRPGVERRRRSTMARLARWGTTSRGRPLGARRQLERVLGRGFDVLHFHNPSLLGAPALLGMGEGMKLYTAHEQWLLCPSHVLWKRTGRVCENPPCRSCEITHLRPPQPWRRSSLLERSAAPPRRADRARAGRAPGCTSGSALLCVPR